MGMLSIPKQQKLSAAGDTSPIVKISPSNPPAYLGHRESKPENYRTFGHLTHRADSVEKTLVLGEIEGRRRGQQRIRWLDGITDWMDMSLSKLWECDGQGRLVCCSPWGHKESEKTEQQN